MPSVLRLRSAGRLLDGLLLLLLVAVAFLLGCYEMGDSDVWWHLRGGRWILENGTVPRLDPFTFGSADRAWVDIHWSYQVVLALAYRAGGVGALVVLGATTGAGAFLAAVTARRGDWPVAASVLCWMPALVLLSFRLDPRPEVFSLLYLGCYLAVLWRLDESPRLAWLLPFLQVLWVNAQGLFVLGPVLTGLFVATRGAGFLARRLRGRPGSTPEEKRWWRHVGAAAAAVAVVCLANPYFIEGVRFPLDLFPKVADPHNPYKKYIDELQGPSDFVARSTRPVAGSNAFFLALYSLIPLLAVSFLFPATWRAWRESRQAGARAAAGSWLSALGAVIALLLLGTLTLSGRGPGWLVALGDNVPLLLLPAGGAAGFGLYRHSRPAAALAGAGATALAAGVAWLDARMLGGGRGLLADVTSTAPWAVPLALAGTAAGGLVLRRGGDLFRILLAGAFAYLALQALQNWSRFALVAGAVLTWNFAAWGRELTADPSPSRGWTGLALRGGLAVVLGLWVAALLGDRYYVHTGEPRHFAFREEPLAFAHDAVRFAGREGLPDRALVYGLAQTGLYDFYHAPTRKPFMDGRLEMPSLETFTTYVNVEDWLRARDPRWEKAVADMGRPLLLLEHEGNHDAEAGLLTHPRWRCVYFDALTAVFVAREDVSEADYPAVDFAARHFRRPAAASKPDVRGAAAREEKALYNLAASLPRGPGDAWRRAPLLLAALDRAAVALDEEPGRPDVWVLLGNCHWDLNPDPGLRPPNVADEWQVERGIWWAQATYCFRQAAQLRPEHHAAWRALFQIYGARGMLDAQAAAGERWLRTDPKVTARQRSQVEEVARVVAGLRERAAPSARPTGLDARLPEEAVRLLEAARGRPGRRWTWAHAEPLARLYLHLGRPADARRVWEEAGDCPSAAVRLRRLAVTYWIERDLDAALSRYGEAAEADPQAAEPYWARAMIHVQRGDAGGALAACREGLRRSPTARQRADLEALKELAAGSAPGPE